MPIDKELLREVVCPKCKGDLTLKEDEGAFLCSACRLAYKIEDGIPNFLIDEATALTDVRK